MTEAVDTILTLWERNGRYGLALTQDLPVEGWVDQPAGRVNHPAWLLSHLIAYHQVLTPMIRGASFADPADAEFGMKSQPLADAAIYLTGDELRSGFERGHALVAQALGEEGPPCLAHPTPLDRWKSAFPTLADILMHLMVWHEAVHLGQLSAWRRAVGMPPIPLAPVLKPQP